MGQTMQDLKKKGQEMGQQKGEEIKGQAQEKGSDVKQKGEEIKKKAGI